jgi:hypothetical protein
LNLLEGFVKDEVFIDFGSEIMYGDDQCYVDYPCRFPTVGFQLMATNGLSQIADRIRKDAGFRPMHPMDEYTDDTCDNDGWYDFYVGLNGFADNHMDSCIEFVVVNSDSEDNEELYTIELNAEEQTAIYNRLDEQCRKYEGKSCEELLAEARKQMEEDMKEDL